MHHKSNQNWRKKWEILNWKLIKKMLKVLKSAYVDCRRRKVRDSQTNASETGRFANRRHRETNLTKLSLIISLLLTQSDQTVQGAKTSDWQVQTDRHAGAASHCSDEATCQLTSNHRPLPPDNPPWSPCSLTTAGLPPPLRQWQWWRRSWNAQQLLLSFTRRRRSCCPAQPADSGRHLVASCKDDFPFEDLKRLFRAKSNWDQSRFRGQKHCHHLADR